MAELRFVAVVYEDLLQAERSLAAVEHVDPVDAAIVVRDHQGRIQLRQTRDRSIGESSVAGGTVGLLAGLLLGIPVGAALLGLLAGGGLGLRDRGIKDDRLRELGRRLHADQAVLCVLVSPDALGDVHDCIAPYGGEAIDTGVELP
ncbi:MAG TPA: DUF1269 domain-containing protein [Gaiellaceae bacterium]|nr:DUF1269 domain-containing protein [Gaiellaceae bacterium]